MRASSRENWRPARIRLNGCVIKGSSEPGEDFAGTPRLGRLSQIDGPYLGQSVMHQNLRRVTPPQFATCRFLRRSDSPPHFGKALNVHRSFTPNAQSQSPKVRRSVAPLQFSGPPFCNRMMQLRAVGCRRNCGRGKRPLPQNAYEVCVSEVAAAPPSPCRTDRRTMLDPQSPRSRTHRRKMDGYFLRLRNTLKAST